MEPRLIIAYTLMLLLAAPVAAFAGYHIFQACLRSYARRLRREARARALAESNEGNRPG